MKLTKQQKHALEKILEDGEIPCTPGASYVEVGNTVKRTEAPELVEGVPNQTLLTDPKFVAGWAQCHADMLRRIDFWVSADKKALRKYAGKT